MEEYIRNFNNYKEISIPFQSLEGKPSYHIFPNLLKKGKREKFMENLKE